MSLRKLKCMLGRHEYSVDLADKTETHEKDGAKWWQLYRWCIWCQHITKGHFLLVPKDMKGGLPPILAATNPARREDRVKRWWYKDGDPLSEAESLEKMDRR